MNQIFEYIKSGTLDDIVKLIRNTPSAKDAKDERGFPAIVLAAYSNRSDIVSMLIEAGCDVNQLDAARNTALMGVAFKGYVQIAEELIAAKSDIDHQNVQGATALIYAAMFGHKDIAALLIDAGADCKIVDHNQKSAIDHAKEKNFLEMATLLEKS